MWEVLQNASPTKHSPCSMATYEVYLNLNPLRVSPCPAEPSPSNFRMVSIPSWETFKRGTSTAQPFWPTCHGFFPKSSAKIIQEPDLRGHLLNASWVVSIINDPRLKHPEFVKSVIPLASARHPHPHTQPLHTLSEYPNILKHQGFIKIQETPQLPFADQLDEPAPWF